MLAVFEGEAAADRFLQQSALAAAYRSRSEECLTLKLRATSSRGAWGGQVIVPTRSAGVGPDAGPVAALTRASIRLSRSWAFWSRSPAAERDLAQAAGCRLAVGLGEAPLLRQATLSLWDDQAAMDRYARSGAHLAAIRASAAGGFFAESMFVRFVVLSVQGRWHGRHHG
jgi:spheroidene monooxygenase